MSQDARSIEEANTLRRANILGLRYLDVRSLQSKPLYQDLLTNEEMYRTRTVPIVSSKDGITFAITTNTPPRVRDEVRNRFNEHRVDFVLISDSAYSEYMKLYDPPEEVVYQDIKLEKAVGAVGIEQISQTLLKVKADDMLAYIVQQAFRLRASDIHLEVEEKFMRIRIRVHGVLHPIAELPLERHRMLISAIASAANLSTSSPDPQTGHIGKTYHMEDGSEVKVNLRIETVQGIYGMNVVMRLFNFNPDMLHLEKLGLDEYEESVLRDIINKPSGLVMIVGPTGSGKSTTLYSILNELINPERKLITLEDPVEYQIPGITQIPINTQGGASFNEGLRAVLRLDPDVIMVGEIRDDDTAKTALQAALTGHLVLSTYHASSAATAMTRIMDATNENPLFLSSIRLIQAQRLVRRLDDSTKQAYQPEPAVVEQIRNVLESLPDNVQKPDINNLTLYHPGASDENPFGYSGQIAIREMLVMNDSLQAMLASHTDITSQSIETEAIRHGGMLTMLQDGVLKAIAGETTIEEIYRVVG
ncbi:type II/IV secretion system protein [Candidatus Saccharibacteria bacterium]|nr:type II/IV secretion system protein [Candidatus Saccharibacteria bacterium]MCB9821607.1 type II/IV secretion system protein [Candidatus Nomurabacteria bacterium]